MHTSDKSPYNVKLTRYIQMPWNDELNNIYKYTHQMQNKKWGIFKCTHCLSTFNTCMYISQGNHGNYTCTCTNLNAHIT